MVPSTVLELPKERDLFFNVQVDQTTIGDLTKKIIDINEHDAFLKKMYSVYDIEYVAKPIRIFIDSYGGYVYQCFGLLSVIERSLTPVHTIVTGCAMSCGFMILISGHKRFGHRLSTPLYHQVSSGAFGTVKQMEEEIEEAKRLQGIIEELVLSKTKIPKKKLQQVFQNKVDWYMNAADAKSYGVIDEILK